MSRIKRNKQTILFNNTKLLVDDFLISPVTNSKNFAYISGVRGLDDGYICLKWGMHRGYHKGFGCLHIWTQHGNEFIIKKFCNEIEDLPSLIDKILIPGATILDTGTGRPAVVRNSLGTLILDCPSDSRDYYSIITFYLNSNIQGTVVGSVRGLPK